MLSHSGILALALGLALTAPTTTAQDCSGDPGHILDLPTTVEIGGGYHACMTAPGGSQVFLLVSLDDGPTPTQFGPLCIGFPAVVFPFQMPVSGEVCIPHHVPCEPAIIGLVGYFQFVAIAPTGASGRSNGVTMLTMDGPCNETCEPCDGQVDELTLEYLGNDEADVLIIMQQGGHVVFDETVQPGGVFTFEGQSNQDTFGPEIDVFVDGQLNAEIHTSCSFPIGPGLVIGDFLVVTGSSKNGGLLCPTN